MIQSRVTLDEVLNDSDNYPTAESAWRARAQYLEVVLAAVLREHFVKGVMKVDLLEAARHSDVLVDAVDSRHALIVWGDIDVEEVLS